MMRRMMRVRDISIHPLPPAFVLIFFYFFVFFRSMGPLRRRRPLPRGVATSRSPSSHLRWLVEGTDACDTAWVRTWAKQSLL